VPMSEDSLSVKVDVHLNVLLDVSLVGAMHFFIFLRNVCLFYISNSLIRNLNHRPSVCFVFAVRVRFVCLIVLLERSTLVILILFFS